MLPGLFFPAYFATEEVIDTVALRGMTDLGLILADWPAGIDPNWILTGEVEPVDNNGVHELVAMVHPDLLAAERLMVTIEYRAIAEPHLLELSFFNHAGWSQADSLAHPDGDGWRVIEKVLVRRGLALPFGGVSDEFVLRMQSVEVRSLVIEDGGPLGDLNLDQQINTTDSAIVLTNFGETGDLSPEQGDANGDGKVDVLDLLETTPGVE